MMKNLILLVALAWVSFSYAKSPVVHQEDMKDVEGYKVEQPVEEVQRGVAGGKFKKKEAEKQEEPTWQEAEDSEVRYWQYSE